MNNNPKNPHKPGIAITRLDTRIKMINFLLLKNAFFLFNTNVNAATTNEIRGNNKCDKKRFFTFIQIQKCVLEIDPLIYIIAIQYIRRRKT